MRAVETLAISLLAVVAGCPDAPPPKPKAPPPPKVKPTFPPSEYTLQQLEPGQWRWCHPQRADAFTVTGKLLIDNGADEPVSVAFADRADAVVTVEKQARAMVALASGPVSIRVSGPGDVQGRLDWTSKNGLVVLNPGGAWDYEVHARNGGLHWFVEARYEARTFFAWPEWDGPHYLFEALPEKFDRRRSDGSRSYALLHAGERQPGRGVRWTLDAEGRPAREAVLLGPEQAIVRSFAEPSPTPATLVVDPAGVPGRCGIEGFELPVSAHGLLSISVDPGEHALTLLADDGTERAARLIDLEPGERRVWNPGLRTYRLEYGLYGDRPWQPGDPLVPPPFPLRGLELIPVCVDHFDEPFPEKVKTWVVDGGPNQLRSRLARASVDPAWADALRADLQVLGERARKELSPRHREVLAPFLVPGEPPSESALLRARGVYQALASDRAAAAFWLKVHETMTPAAPETLAAYRKAVELEPALAPALKDVMATLEVRLGR